VIVDGKYIKLRGGGAPDRVGTHGGRCEGRAVVLTGEVDVVSHWDLPVRP